MKITITIEVDDMELKKVFEEESYSKYAIVFDKCNDACNMRCEEDNLTFLVYIKNFMHDKLRARGYLFLNDVYDALGAKRTAIGQVAGWVWTEDIQDDFDITIAKLKNKDGYTLDFPNIRENILDYL